jgi:hypothetical protein
MLWTLYERHPSDATQLNFALYVLRNKSIVWGYTLCQREKQYKSKQLFVF